MEIEKLKENKLQLEKDIRNLIFNFIKENNLNDIEVYTVVETAEQALNKKVVTNIVVNVDIKI